MSYRASIVRSAQAEFASLPDSIRARIELRLLDLAAEPRPHGSQKLRQTERYRIRVGNYRVIYAINDAERMVVILSIGHRKEIYR